MITTTGKGNQAGHSISALHHRGIWCHHVDMCPFRKLFESGCCSSNQIFIVRFQKAVGKDVSNYSGNIKEKGTCGRSHWEEPEEVQRNSWLRIQRDWDENRSSKNTLRLVLWSQLWRPVASYLSSISVSYVWMPGTNEIALWMGGKANRMGSIAKSPLLWRFSEATW